MPTPIGHTLTALAAWSSCRSFSAGMIRQPVFWLCLLAANAPDLDFLPGLFLGNESLFHRGASHSLGGAALFMLSIFIVALMATRTVRRAAFAAVLGTGLFVAHLMLDVLGHDPGPPYGVQILWPLTDAYIQSPLVFFPNLDRHPFDLSIVGRLLPVAAFETALLSPWILFTALWRRRRGRGNTLPS